MIAQMLASGKKGSWKAALKALNNKAKQENNEETFYVTKDMNGLELNYRSLCLLSADNDKTSMPISKFRQYFFNRAVGAQSLKEMFYSMRALRSPAMSQAVFLKKSGLIMPSI